MNPPLRILCFQPEHPDASKYIRVLEPMGVLRKRGHTILSVEKLLAAHGQEMTPEKLVDQCDIFLISNVDISPPRFEVFERMVAHCNETKKLIIYDFDDYYNEIPDSNPHVRNCPEWNYFVKLIGMAHVLTVTGRELQQVLSEHHPRIFVLPNMIDFEIYKPRPRHSQKLRIGWTAGITHLSDFPIVASVIRKLQQKHHFEFILFGLFPDFLEFISNAEMIAKYSIQPEELQDSYHRAQVEFMKHAEGIECALVPAVSYADFPAYLTNLDLDIGICPIRDARWNRCRSGVKFYQYAATKTATIASNVYPYSDEPVVLAENTEESWTEKLESLILDPVFRGHTTKLQFEYVFKNRNLNRNGLAWEILYQELVKHLCRKEGA